MQPGASRLKGGGADGGGGVNLPNISSQKNYIFFKYTLNFPSIIPQVGQLPQKSYLALFFNSNMVLGPCQS